MLTTERKYIYQHECHEENKKKILKSFDADNNCKPTKFISRIKRNKRNNEEKQIEM